MSRPQSASPETDIQSTEAETEVLTSASVRNAESETLIPEKIEFWVFFSYCGVK